MIKPADRVSHFTQDVWSVFSPLAVKCNAVNLGQGFPNFPPPEFIKNAACDAIRSNPSNQYAHPRGTPDLRKALSKTFSPLFNRELDPESNIIVTAGANEGIYATLSAFLDPEDECIIIEPFFDQYEPNITLNGGVPVYVPLRLDPSAPKDAHGNVSSGSWKLDISELKSKITSRSKVIIVNTPHNPVGKVFSRQELLEIGKVAIENNLLILSDEVYERLVYKPDEHVRIATLSEELWNRTVTIGSAGKTFAVTGWRLGFLTGPKELVQHVLNAHTRIVFCANAPLQTAVTEALNTSLHTPYYETQIREYLNRRDKLISGFKKIGLSLTVPQGSYFVLVDTSKIRVPDEDWKEIEKVKLPSDNKDWKMCYWLTTKIGIAAIPPSSFYSPTNAHLASDYARFCFCKTDETLNEALKRLEVLGKYVVN
ncbi:pyridoxal phosphate-dependent transferase [Paraphysoderma sedebokerense]|nr:pyridoxal phosphate-dependent transferase [Paraphysoderma sedebokerense]